MSHALKLNDLFDLFYFPVISSVLQNTFFSA